MRKRDTKKEIRTYDLPLYSPTHLLLLKVAAVACLRIFSVVFDSCLVYNQSDTERHRKLRPCNRAQSCFCCLVVITSCKSISVCVTLGYFASCCPALAEKGGRMSSSTSAAERRTETRRVVGLLDKSIAGPVASLWASSLHRTPSFGRLSDSSSNPGQRTRFCTTKTGMVATGTADGLFVASIPAYSHRRAPGRGSIRPMVAAAVTHYYSKFIFCVVFE